jgi:hypothetical protein
VLLDTDAVEQLQPNKKAIGELIAKAITKFAKPVYCYRGQPIFIGTVTKELVEAAIIANREQRPVSLFQQFYILSTFSGIPCPVQHGQTVSGQDVKAVFHYVKSIAQSGWKRDVKYFYRFEVP